MDDLTTPVAPEAESGYLTTAGTRTLLDWDPNGPNDGNIDAALYFRLGIWYSLSSGSTPARGDVQILGLCWQ